MAKLEGRKQVLQQFPEGLLARVDTWAGRNHLNRTDAINQICVRFLDMDIIDKQQRQIEELQKKVVSLGMEAVRKGRK